MYVECRMELINELITLMDFIKFEFNDSLYRIRWKTILSEDSLFVGNHGYKTIILIIIYWICVKSPVFP